MYHVALSDQDHKWDKNTATVGEYVERLMNTMQRQVQVPCGRGAAELWNVIFEYRPARVIDASATKNTHRKIQDLVIPNPWTFAEWAKTAPTALADEIVKNSLSTPLAGAGGGHQQMGTEVDS